MVSAHLCQCFKSASWGFADSQKQKTCSFTWPLPFNLAQKVTYPPVVMMAGIGPCLSSNAASKSSYLFCQELNKESCQCRQEERQNKTILYIQFASDLFIPNSSFLSVSSTLSHGMYSAYLSPCCKMHTTPKWESNKQHQIAFLFKEIQVLSSALTSAESVTKLKKIM